MKTIGAFLICGFMLSCIQKRENTDSWILILKQEGKKDLEICRLPGDIKEPFVFDKDLHGVHVKFTLDPSKAYTVFKATASTAGRASVFFSLEKHYTREVPYNFSGEVKTPEIFRQSPHDVNAWITDKIAKQAIPVVALKSDSGFLVALNGSPALYENYTSQVFYTNDKIIALSSGDNGETPGIHPDSVNQLALDYNTEKGQIMAPGKIRSYYHPISPGQPHVFEGLLFTTRAKTLNGVRKDINQYAAMHFSGGTYKDYFGALAFTTAYMNLRVNETGNSRYWVVPSVEYSNTQYCRDAFWISMMLPPEFSTESLKNELAVVNNYAEYPLFAIIWAHRSYQETRKVDLLKVQKYVDAIEARSRNSWYYSFLKSDGRLDFQYWCDAIAFEKDDVITYNQGLFALAISAAREMGLSTKTNPEKALDNYRSMYNSELGFYPVSEKKNNILAPDPLVPDLLSQIYFNKKILPDERIKLHYNAMIGRSKTRFGFKTLCLPDGAYLPSSEYDVKGYTSQTNRDKTPDGEYARGGSFFLYDNLFLIDAYLHGIKEAEDQLIWRVSMDFQIGNTTYECLNTKTGNPWKPNMGWNVAIYSIWRKLVDEGNASPKLFENINKISRANE
jgi:hypothetical protein